MQIKKILNQEPSCFTGVVLRDCIHETKGRYNPLSLKDVTKIYSTIQTDGSVTWKNPHGNRGCHWDFETACILAINVVEETIEGLIIIKI